MTTSMRLTRAGLSLLLFGIVVTVLPSTGDALAYSGSCTTPGTLSSISISNPDIVGGTSDSGAVFITAAPSNSLTIPVTSNSPYVTVTSPAVINNSANGSYSITTQPVATKTIATLSASYNGGSKSVTLTLLPPTLVSQSVGPYSNPLTLGKTVQYTVTISSPAPAGGLTVPLTDNFPSALAGPSSVTIPAGSMMGTATFTDVYTGGGLGADVTIGAPGLSGYTVWVK